MRGLCMSDQRIVDVLDRQCDELIELMATEMDQVSLDFFQTKLNFYHNLIGRITLHDVNTDAAFEDKDL